MKTKSLAVAGVLSAMLIGAAALVGSVRQPALAALNAGPSETAANTSELASAPSAPAQQLGTERLIMSYAAKFVCTEALLPGQFFYGPVAPLVNQKTDVLVHNPNGVGVTFYKKAVISPVENFTSIPQGVAPGAWRRVTLAPDYSFRIDCDDIAKLLTGSSIATFLGTYGQGVTVEGFVVIGIGPQPEPGTNTRYLPLDVTAEYVRNSEVFKKDIHFQAWWTWWWWNLPWRLGYAYERVIQVPPTGRNIDCRDLLTTALHGDVTSDVVTPTLAGHTHQALEAGRGLDPSRMDQVVSTGPPAIVPLIGGCTKFMAGANLMADISFVLVSNKSSADVNPYGYVPQPVGVIYPWVPGRWYDLAIVTPQNKDVDLYDHVVTWQQTRWGALSGANAAAIANVMPYYFPYSCGWGYWWWWNNTSNCISVGVGEGESLDVVPITPQRVFMPQWPPIP